MSGEPAPAPGSRDPRLRAVEAVLFVNGVWLLGHVENREIIILNVFTGVVGFMVAVFAVAQGDPASVQLAACASVRPPPQRQGHPADRVHFLR
jgi:hypothetical protein